MSPAIFDFLNSIKQGRTRANCPYCHGVKCLGACGNNPVTLKDASIRGLVRLDSEMVGIIESETGEIFNFEAQSSLGKEILAACPPGELCQIEAQHDNGSIRHVAYMEICEDDGN